MSYEDIFILGWLSNILMLLINIVVIFLIIKNNEVTLLKEQSLALEELKQEYNKYYPYHKKIIILVYFLPFAGFFKVGFRLFEMFLFLSKNKNANIYNFIEYKYIQDIKKAKNS